MQGLVDPIKAFKLYSKCEETIKNHRIWFISQKDHSDSSVCGIRWNKSESMETSWADLTVQVQDHVDFD